MREQLIKQLLDIPLDIEAKENELIVRKNDLEELKHSISYYEYQMSTQVEKDAENNKELSNATKRKLELKRRLEQSKTYSALQEELKEIQAIYHTLSFRVARLKREFSGAKAISRLGE